MIIKLKWLVGVPVMAVVSAWLGFILGGNYTAQEFAAARAQAEMAYIKVLKKSELHSSELDTLMDLHNRSIDLHLEIYRATLSIPRTAYWTLDALVGHAANQPIEKLIREVAIYRRDNPFSGIAYTDETRREVSEAIAEILAR